MWDSGHIFKYYVRDKKVLYKASPGLWRRQLDTFVDGKPTDCTIFYSDRDVKALAYMLNYDKRVWDFLVIKKKN